MIQWKEHPDSRQATKQDLLDIVRALGVYDPRAKLSVPDLRQLIRNKLEVMATGKEPVCKHCGFTSKLHVVGFCMPGARS